MVLKSSRKSFLVDRKNRDIDLEDGICPSGDNAVSGHHQVFISTEGNLCCSGGDAKYFGDSDGYRGSAGTGGRR
jgi:hypothetical protein